MKNNEPYLLIELNDKNFIFFVVQFNENGEFKLLDTIIEISKGINNGKIIDSNISLDVIKKNLTILEKKINHTFKSVTIINNQKNLKCINVSGFKRCNGSQVTSEDISYILNNIKKQIIDNEPNFSIIHLFNSGFNLDRIKLDKLPIGLHGDFYSHHLTLFLLPKNDIKDLTFLFNKCYLNIDRIILKSFIDGLNVIKSHENEKNQIALIEIEEKNINMSIFENSSFIYSEKFSFGSNIIMNDVSKLCSLDLDLVKTIFNEINFDYLKNGEEKEYLSEKYFKENTFRKISLEHLNNIISARVDEIIDVVYKKNVNIKNLRKNNKSIYLSFEDRNIYNNFKNKFSKIPSNSERIIYQYIDKEKHLSDGLSAADLIGRGWGKEAIPIIQTKKSVISRLFDLFFN